MKFKKLGPSMPKLYQIALLSMTVLALGLSLF